MESKLKPCPFCGATYPENIKLERRRDGNVVYCLGCGVQICMFVSEDELIEIWNRRTSEEVKDENA